MARKAPKPRRPKDRSRAGVRPLHSVTKHDVADDTIEIEDFRPLETKDLDDAADKSASSIESDELPERDDSVEPGFSFDESETHPDSAERTDAADRSALVTIDPMGRYLAEVRRFPLLSREEETRIAKRYFREHNPEDAYRLVTANLRLVIKIALEFARASRNVLDLIQEGNVGLMEAVKNFDPYRGIRFPSYAVWWVRAYIYRYLINNWRLVKIGTTQAQRKLFFNLRKESERLEAQGFTPQPKLLAQRMGVKESEVREMQERMAQSEFSLDAPNPSGDETRLIDVLPDRDANPEEAAAEQEWRSFARDRVEEFENTLQDKEREIFRARLLSEDPPTLQEVGAKFGISRERVRQIENRLKQRLKQFIRAGAADI